MEDINAALQRKIKSGKQYNKYFEKVSCKPTNLGYGNTTYGLHQMQNWALKFQYQTEEIAKQLAQKTIPLTIESIYNFLHDHLQYQLDGEEQQLRSPACSWQQRNSGIDCKSYSVFASTILLNLGIDHYFRKVKQPGYNEKNWTHVYVVVPNGNEYYVIDGTIHNNVEVLFIEKEDLLMESKLKYVGLNAAVATSNNDFEIHNGFKIVLNALSKVGVSQTKISELNERVKNAYYKYGSFSFPFLLVNENTLLIDNERITLREKQGLNAPSLVTPISTTVAGIDTSMFNTSTSATINSSNTNASSGILNALSTLAVDPTGTTAIISSISSILPIGDIMANVSNVLKYGLDSWGAATDPEKAKVEIQSYFQILETKLNAVKTANNAQLLQDSLNQLELAARYYDDMFRRSVDRRDWAGSTTAAFELMDETFSQYYLNTVEALVNSLRNKGYQITSATNQASFGDYDHIFQPQVAESNTTAEKNGTFPYKVYTIIGVPNANGTATNANIDNINPDNKPTPDSNMGKIIGYGAAAALAGFLVVPMLNKGKK